MIVISFTNILYVYETSLHLHTSLSHEVTQTNDERDEFP